MDVKDLGLAGYKDVLGLQHELLRKRIAGRIPDTLIITEHHPVVTLGRLAKEESIIGKGYFERENIPVIRTSRGGKITYHAPGQLVLYPIIDLKEKKRDVSQYIDFLEKTVAGSLNRLGIPAMRNEARRGVWVGEEKIAFIGIALKKWVTFHGISVNINNDIGAFLEMRPCGESDITVTSAKEFLGRELKMDEVKKTFVENFARDLSVEYTELQRVG
jgi:lipoate-protein ligase B